MTPQSAAAIVEAIQRTRAVVVLRLSDHRETVRIGEILAEAGLGIMEITLDHPDSLSALRALADAIGEHVVLGAGTVTSSEQVAAAADCGARFIVSPHTDPAVIRTSMDAGLASLPGACSPTEIATAVAAGAPLVKLFPAGPLGPDYLRALRGPFRNVPFVPTGGIAHDALRPWYAAGAVAVGLGSDLLAGGLDELPARARTVAAQAAEHTA